MWLGKYTPGETRDLIRAKDITLNATDEARARLGHAPDAQWDSQYALLKGAYTDARSAFEQWHAEASRSSVLPTATFDKMGDAHDQFQRIVRALQPTPGLTQPGDLQDLYNRVTEAGARPIIDSASLQPNAPDVDLHVFQAADKAVRSLENPDAAWASARPYVFGALAFVGLVSAAKLFGRR